MSIFHQIFIRSRAYTLRGALDEGARECIIFKHPKIDDICFVVKIYTFTLRTPDTTPTFSNVEYISFDKVDRKKSSVIFFGIESLPSNGFASIPGVGVVPEDQWEQVLSSIMDVKVNTPKDYFKSGTFAIVSNLSDDDKLMRQLKYPLEVAYKKLLEGKKEKMRTASSIKRMNF